MNHAFCGKSTKFGTHVHDTNKSKFSYSAKPDFPRGVSGGHLKKWPLCHHISETKRRRAIIVDSIVFWGVYFRKRIAKYIMPLYPPFWMPFEQNGGHLQRNRSILETKRRRASIVTLCLGFVGRRFQRKHCRIHHAINCIHHFESHLKNMASISKVILLSQKLRGVEPSISALCLGFVRHILAEQNIVSYVSVLGINYFDVYGGHFTKWRPFQ